MGEKLNYKKQGEGQPVVIMHGLLGMLDNWQTFARKLAEEYEVYTLDLRNHGKSFHHPEMDYPIMAEDLAMFMDEHQLNSASVLGHSMGGKVAMQFAHHHPERVDKLIVADISPQRYTGGHQEIFDALMSVEPEKAEERSEIEEHLFSRIKNKAIVLFLMKNLSRSKEGGFRWKPNLPAIVDNYQHILNEIESDEQFQGKTLFLKGGKSGYITADSQKLIDHLFPQNYLKEIPKAGHWIHAEAPSETLKQVREFLVF